MSSCAYLSWCCVVDMIPHEYPQDLSSTAVCHTEVQKEHRTALSLCHTLSLGEPLIYPRASSCSSFIPMLCGSHSGTVWEQAGAAHKAPCGSWTSRAQLSSKSLRVVDMWRKTRVRVGDFSRLFTKCSLPASVGHRKVYRGSWNNGLLSLKCNRGRNGSIIVKGSYNSPGNWTSDSNEA